MLCYLLVAVQILGGYNFPYHVSITSEAKANSAVKCSLTSQTIDAKNNEASAIKEQANSQ
jgi:hypothetical protein